MTPTIITPRLILRAQTEDDLPHCAAMWSNTTVVKHVGGQTRSYQDCWFTLLRGLGMWALKDYGYLTVADRRTGAFIGEVGFADFKRGLDPDISEWPEAGWVIDEPHWGKGYATEALKGLHEWLDETHAALSAVCIINEEHSASIRVAEKLGYREWERTNYKGAPIIIFQRPAAHSAEV